MPIKKIEDPIYNTTIHFIFDCEKEKAQKYLVDYQDLYDFSGFEELWGKAGIAYAGRGHDSFIIFPLKFKTWDFTTILAHEGLHVTCGVLRSIGISLVPESEEAYTYYHTWIMQSLTDIYKKHYKRK